MRDKNTGSISAKRGESYSPPEKRGLRDLIVLIMIAVLVFAVSAYFEAYQWLTHVLNRPQWHAWRFEEYIPVLIVLSLGFAAFSYRRWKDLRKELVESRAS